MTEQQKERLDKQALLEHLNTSANELYDSGAIVSAGIVVILRDEIQSGSFDANDSEAIKGWGECEAQNQQLREDNERLSYLNEHYKQDAELMKMQRDHLREELEQAKKERDKQTALAGHRVDIIRDLNQERADSRNSIESLRSELAAKDKVLDLLQSYLVKHREKTPYGLYQEQITNVLEEARSILAQYKAVSHET